MKTETFYTGGGITLAQMEIDKTRYAVVSSEQSDYLSVYQNPGSYDDLYLPEDMIFCKEYKDLSKEYKEVYQQLKNTLQ